MAQTPTDPTKAQVWITKGIDDLDFEFYFPNGPKGDPGGITLGSALGSANLNDIKAPGVYRQDSGTPATLLNNYPVPSTGIMYVDDRLGGGSSVMQTYYPFMGASGINPRQFYKRYLVASTTWGPWEAYVSQRVDQTAGRAIYTWDTINNRDQLIYGDTGWRDVTSGLINGWTGTSLWIRRIGYVIYIRAYSMVGTAATLNKFYTLPAGFQRSPSGTEYLTAADGFTVLGIESAGGVLAFSNTANRFAGAFGNFTPYTTTDTWPTTLPGVPAVGGVVPNA